MRDFTRARRLVKMEFEAKLAYTLFLLLLLGGIGLTSFWSWRKGAVTPEGIATHFRGSPKALAYPKTLSELLETAHFHLFTMPVIFLIMSHLFYLTRWKKSVQHAVTLLFFAALIGELSLPFLIRFVSAKLSPFYLASHLLLYFCMVFMGGASLKEMWLG